MWRWGWEGVGGVYTVLALKSIAKEGHSPSNHLITSAVRIVSESSGSYATFVLNVSTKIHRWK